MYSSAHQMRYNSDSFTDQSIAAGRQQRNSCDVPE